MDTEKRIEQLNSQEGQKEIKLGMPHKRQMTRLNIMGITFVFMMVGAYFLLKHIKEHQENRYKEHHNNVVKPFLDKSPAHKFVFSQYTECEKELFTSSQECLLRVKDLAEIKGYEDQLETILDEMGKL